MATFNLTVGAVAAGAAPVTVVATKTTGTSVTWTVPAGTSTLQIEVWGGGGAGGGGDDSHAGSGGGGGGYSKKTSIAVTGGSTVVTYTVGASVAGNGGTGATGGTSSTTGPASVSATGGTGGTLGNTVSPTGGTAGTGTTSAGATVTNTTGTNGVAAGGGNGNGGAGAGPSGSSGGGAGGTGTFNNDGVAGTAPGGGGSGGGTKSTGTTGGSGARGQVAFTYTEVPNFAITGLATTSFVGQLSELKTTGTSVTWTVPSGYNTLQIEVWGGGASGGSADDGFGGGGGGGGGYSSQTNISVTGGSTTVTYTVAASVSTAGGSGNDGTNGNSTTCSGAASVSASGGNKGIGGGVGTGGSAGTGTTFAGPTVTNTTGTAGSTTATTNGAVGGAGAGPTGSSGGGAGGTANSGAGTAPGGGGGGGQGGGTRGTGGTGARGQVQFTYTYVTPTGSVATSDGSATASGRSGSQYSVVGVASTNFVGQSIDTSSFAVTGLATASGQSGSKFAITGIAIASGVQGYSFNVSGSASANFVGQAINTSTATASGDATGSKMQSGSQYQVSGSASVSGRAGSQYQLIGDYSIASGVPPPAGFFAIGVATAQMQSISVFHVTGLAVVSSAPATVGSAAGNSLVSFVGQAIDTSMASAAGDATGSKMQSGSRFTITSSPTAQFFYPLPQFNVIGVSEGNFQSYPYALLVPIADKTILGFTAIAGSTVTPGLFYTTVNEGFGSPDDGSGVISGGTNTTLSFTLSALPFDVYQVRAVTILVRLANSGTTPIVQQWSSARLYQTDGTTPLTNSVSIVNSSTINTYALTPTVTGGDSYAVWNNPVIVLTLNSGTQPGATVTDIQVNVNYVAAYTGTILADSSSSFFTGGPGIYSVVGDSTGQVLAGSQFKLAVGLATGKLLSGSQFGITSTPSANGRTFSRFNVVGDATGSYAQAGSQYKLIAGNYSTANGQSGSFFTIVGSATASAGTASGTTGSSSGDSIVNGVGRAIDTSVMSALGIASGSFNSNIVNQLVASATGLAVVSGQSGSIATASGLGLTGVSSTGSIQATADGAAIVNGVRGTQFSASGSSTANGLYGSIGTAAGQAIVSATSPTGSSSGAIVGDSTSNVKSGSRFAITGLCSTNILTNRSVQVVLVPVADKSVVNFNAVSGGIITSNLYTAIDEGTVSPNDNDYVQSTDNNVNTAKFTLGTIPNNIGLVTGVTISLRSQEVYSKTDDIQDWASCQLFQSDGTTALTSSSAMSDSIVVVAYTFNPTIIGTTQSAWNNAVFAITTTSVSSSFTSPRLMAVQVTLTYVPISAGFAPGDATGSYMQSGGIVSAVGSSTAIALKGVQFSAAGDSTALMIMGSQFNIVGLTLTNVVSSAPSLVATASSTAFGQSGSQYQLIGLGVATAFANVPSIATASGTSVAVGVAHVFNVDAVAMANGDSTANGIIGSFFTIAGSSIATAQSGSQFNVIGIASAVFSNTPPASVFNVIGLASLFGQVKGSTILTSGTTFLVPTGFNTLQIEIWGAGGGGGGGGDDQGGGGGGGGGYSSRSVIAVIGGTTAVTYAIGTGGGGGAQQTGGGNAGTTGVSTVITAPVSMTATGGLGGGGGDNNAIGGTGGSGTTVVVPSVVNGTGTTGQAASGFNGAAGGAGANPSGGAGGVANSGAGVAPGGGGGGGQGRGSTAGAGARGQVRFTYQNLPTYSFMALGDATGSQMRAGMIASAVGVAFTNVIALVGNTGSAIGSSTSAFVGSVGIPVVGTASGDSIVVGHIFLVTADALANGDATGTYANAGSQFNAAASSSSNYVGQLGAHAGTFNVVGLATGAFVGKVSAVSTFTTGTSATWTVPSGISTLQIEVWGGGGGGNGGDDSGGNGGGGGGYSKQINIAVTGGTTVVTYTVGLGASAGGTGGTSSATGPASVSATGGQGGFSNGAGGGAGGTGTTSTGSFTNISGSAGLNPSGSSGGAGGAGAGPGGGAGGTINTAGNVIGGGGGGASRRFGSGGSGARGQVTFTYSFNFVPASFNVIGDASGSSAQSGSQLDSDGLATAIAVGQFNFYSTFAVVVDSQTNVSSTGQFQCAVIGASIASAFCNQGSYTALASSDTNFVAQFGVGGAGTAIGDATGTYANAGSQMLGFGDSTGSSFGAFFVTSTFNATGAAIVNGVWGINTAGTVYFKDVGVNTIWALSTNQLRALNNTYPPLWVRFWGSGGGGGAGVVNDTAGIDGGSGGGGGAYVEGQFGNYGPLLVNLGRGGSGGDPTINFGRGNIGGHTLIYWIPNNVVTATILGASGGLGGVGFAGELGGGGGRYSGGWINTTIAFPNMQGQNTSGQTGQMSGPNLGGAGGNSGASPSNMGGLGGAVDTGSGPGAGTLYGGGGAGSNGLFGVNGGIPTVLPADGADGFGILTYGPYFQVTASAGGGAVRGTVFLLTATAITNFKGLAYNPVIADSDGNSTATGRAGFKYTAAGAADTDVETLSFSNGKGTGPGAATARMQSGSLFNVIGNIPLIPPPPPPTFVGRSIAQSTFSADGNATAIGGQRPKYTLAGQAIALGQSGSRMKNAVGSATTKMLSGSLFNALGRSLFIKLFRAGMIASADGSADANATGQSKARSSFHVTGVAILVSDNLGIHLSVGNVTGNSTAIAQGGHVFNSTFIVTADSTTNVSAGGAFQSAFSADSDSDTNFSTLAKVTSKFTALASAKIFVISGHIAKAQGLTTTNVITNALLASTATANGILILGKARAGSIVRSVGAAFSLFRSKQNLLVSVDAFADGNSISLGRVGSKVSAQGAATVDGVVASKATAIGSASTLFRTTSFGFAQSSSTTIGRMGSLASANGSATGLFLKRNQITSVASATGIAIVSGQAGSKARAIGSATAVSRSQSGFNVNGVSFARMRAGSIATSNGSSTSNYIIRNSISATFSASGTSTANSQSGSQFTVLGDSTVSGVAIITPSVGTADGDSTALFIWGVPYNGDASASGTSTAHGQAGSIFAVVGLSTTNVIYPLASEFHADGNSTAIAYYLTTFIFGSDGGDTTTGGAADTNYVLFFDTTIIWQVQQDIIISKDFLWNTGIIQLQWYQIQGVCKPLDCTTLIDVPGNFCNNQFIQTFVARGLNDLCDQLNNSNLNWQLASVKKWSLPASEIVLGEPPSGPGNCNTLIDVPICQIPACLNFCVQTDAIIRMKMSAVVVDTFFIYTGSGGAVTGGEGDTSLSTGTPTQSTFEYSPDGGNTTTGGTAETDSSWNGDTSVSMKISAIVDDLEVKFGDGGSVPSLTLPSQVIPTSCGICDNMPVVIFMQHNLVQDGVLFNFIQRNGLRLPNVLTMYYNTLRNSWVSNFHMNGLSVDNFGSESWRFTFEWSCVTGQDTWRFSMLCVRKNGEFTLDTRFTTSFPADQICLDIQNLEFNFSLGLNTITGFVTGDNVIANTILITDNIGLFKSKFWLDNPEFEINLSKTGVVFGETLQDISPIFPITSIVGIQSSTFVTG